MAGEWERQGENRYGDGTPGTTRDPGANGYQLTIRFTPDASREDRRSVVDGLDEFLPIVESEPTSTELDVGTDAQSVRLVVEATHDISMIRDALEDVRGVDSVTADRITDPTTVDRSNADGENAHEESKETRETDVDPIGSDSLTDPEEDEFEYVQMETEQVDVEELLADPEYLDFLESFGQLSAANDELSLSEILDYAGESSDIEVTDSGESITSRGESVYDDESAHDDESVYDESARDPSPDPATEQDREPVTDRDDGDRNDATATLLGEPEEGGVEDEQLEEGEVGKEQRRRLRAAHSGSSSSLDTRVTYLESRFHELAAYIDAMEEFIDENGTAEDVLTETNAELRDVRTELETVRERQARQADQLTDARERVERLESRHDALQTEVESLREWRTELAELFR